MLDVRHSKKEKLEFEKMLTHWMKLFAFTSTSVWYESNFWEET